MPISNIILIGMPSSGKTTVGKPLSEALNMGFIDTDLLLSEKAGKSLRDIVSNDGLEVFLKLQEATLMELKAEYKVISTGGSVIYNQEGMKSLAEDGVIIYLKTSLEELEKRITPERRLARSSGLSYKDLYEERTPLYEKYANLIVDCSGRDVEDIVMEIAGKWEKVKKGLLHNK